MCRIAGIYDPSSASLKQDIFRMRDSMHRGGPDDAGVYLDAELPLALGHRRLALIDLSPLGHQPMSDADGELQLVFNGEIYNYLELRAELAAKGHSFRTSSDTEVILKAWQSWGTDCFRRFNGMFAIVIWDRSKKQLILARDYAGIKPLYYFKDRDQFVFASEIRAFKILNRNWAERADWRIPFLCFGHLPEPFTTLDGVVPLEKGCFAILQLPTLEMRTERFHHFAFTSQITDTATAVRLVRETLDAAVQRHLISDAPIGLFLSGGVDSSILTLIAHKYLKDKLKTLSIVFEDGDFSEKQYQDLIRDKTGADHQSFLVTQNEFYKCLPDILAAMDQPSTDGINSYFISKYARASGLTAVLSGIGADELLGGYPSFRNEGVTGMLRKMPSAVLQLAEWMPGHKIKRIATLARKDMVGDFALRRGFFSPAQTAALLDTTQHHVHEVLDQVRKPDTGNATAHFNRASSMEQNLYMQNQLLKDTDYMSMWHHLEVRVPFLDKEFMELCHKIAPEIKAHPTRGKHLLIDAFRDELPEAIWNRKKQGFAFPFGNWMRNVYMRERGRQYKELTKQFLDRKLHWSRYWSYMLSKNQKSIKYYEPGAKKVLFANLKAFSATGGIEKFNRCFLKALNDMETTHSDFIANGISLYDTETDPAYFPNDNYTGYNGSKLRFIRETVRKAKHYDVLVLGHLNLALVGLLAKLRYGKKLRLYLITHGIEVWRPLSMIASKCVQQCTRILAVSGFTKQKIVELHEVNPEKISVFYNTYDPFFKFPETFAKPAYLAERYKVRSDEKIIFTLTRLSHIEKYKGYDQIIESVARMKAEGMKLRYILAGKADDIEQARIEAMIARHGVQDEVLLTGFIPDAEVTDHFLLGDVFAMPSSKEGFGIVFIEAMAAGLQVIAGNIDGSVDALQHGRLGTLVNPEDNEAIFRALKERLNHTLSEAEKQELQQKAIDCFGFEHYTERLRKVLGVAGDADNNKVSTTEKIADGSEAG